jgi:L-lysine 2,3-aminomutase
MPQRITPALVALLAGSRLQASLVLHANHAQELDDSVATALWPLRRAGIVLLNQTVLLAGINDEVEALSALSERLFAIGVLPYYLHLLDQVAGAAHFAGQRGARTAAARSAARAPARLSRPASSCARSRRRRRRYRFVRRKADAGGGVDAARMDCSLARPR